MKRITISNGEVRLGYELADLSPSAYDRVINDWITGEIGVMDEDSPYFDCALEMDKMQTPWFLGECIYSKYKDDIIEAIQINEYLFDEDGDILPICQYVGNHAQAGKTV